MIAASHPILTCAAAKALEDGLFDGDEAKEWPAMQQAGRAIAAAVLRDFEEIGGLAHDGRVLVLAGKGHNGGDALIAAQTILEGKPGVTVEVMFFFGEGNLRPLAAQAWRELATVGGARVRRAAALHDETSDAVEYDLCLDGVFGFQFRAPAEKRVVELLERVNAMPIRLRAAVDLPSAGLFRADFTYATGCVKKPAVGTEEAGRVRYLDLGFFRGGERGEKSEMGEERVLLPCVLAPLTGLRAASSDKRTFGHVFIVGGSRSFPGAVLMSVLAALRSGAGLVTAFVPESVAAAFAARAPEAMWVAWPETPEGGLALEGEHLLRERIERADALVIGPGLGREKETLALAEAIVRMAKVPVVIDADALQPEIVRAGKAKKILTPHAGEFARIAGKTELGEFAKEIGGTVIVKGTGTRIASGGIIYRSFFGGPVLARGGSGDLLAGLIGGLVAKKGTDPEMAAAQGVVWHGLAADALARERGQVAVSTTQLLDYLAGVLREV
ncbi:MAG: NAD(P)H-hydrate dehydratase [Verrucomicrobiota bacterium]